MRIIYSRVKCLKFLRLMILENTSFHRRQRQKEVGRIKETGCAFLKIIQLTGRYFFRAHELNPSSHFPFEVVGIQSAVALTVRSYLLAI